MIDFHCHIITGIDDGARSWDESIAMARIAEQDGIKHIVCTPHVTQGSFDNSAAHISSLVDELRTKLEMSGVDLELTAGAEVEIHPDVPTWVDSGFIAPLGGKRRYVLIELPFQTVPQYTERVVFELLVRGVTPIIAHPERNLGLIGNPNMLCLMIEKGALAQMNSGSILGFFGEQVQRTARVFLQHNMVHFLGTDAHSSDHRSPKMARAYEAVVDAIGEDSARAICGGNALRVLKGEDVPRPEPLGYAVRRRGLLSRVFGR